MKRKLGPVWTAEQIAAGQKFGQAWRNFFGRDGGVIPALKPGRGKGGADLATVRARHEERLLRLPNVVGVSEGIRMRGGKPTGDPALVVLVSRKVPPRKLPKASRVPPNLDGIALDVVEVGPIEALGSR